MSATQTVPKLFFATIIVIMTYFFFSSSWPSVKWSWTIAVAVGLLLLVIFSPRNKIADGLRLLPIIHWPFLLVVPIFIVLSLAHYGIELHVRIAMGLSFFIFETGMEVFWNRISRSKKKDGKT